MLGIAPISDEFIMMTAQEVFTKQHMADQMHRINTEWATSKNDSTINGPTVYIQFHQEHYRTRLLILYQNTQVDGRANRT